MVGIIDMRINGIRDMIAIPFIIIVVAMVNRRTITPMGVNQPPSIEIEGMNQKMHMTVVRIIIKVLVRDMIISGIIPRSIQRIGKSLINLSLSCDFVGLMPRYSYRNQSRNMNRDYEDDEDEDFDTRFPNTRYVYDNKNFKSNSSMYSKNQSTDVSGSDNAADKSTYLKLSCAKTR